METTSTKRVKKVFKNMSEVAHVWAYQQQDEARCRNGFFEGDTIYSYGRHFPIARIYEKYGEKTVFFTTRTYSSTTSKHVGEVRAACSHMNKLYMHTVVSFATFEEMSYDHRDNIDYFKRDISESLRMVGKAREYKNMHLSKARHYLIQLQSYIKFFRLENVIDEDTKNIIADCLSDKWENEIKAYNVAKALREADPKTEEKREKARLARQKSEEKAKLEQIEKWRNFEANEPYKRSKYRWRWNHEGTRHDFLRYNQENQRVETSKRVKVPVEIAHQFYRYIKIMVAKGGCTSADCCNYQLLNTYTVRSITEKGIEVGCHTIPMSEIDYIANLLGWQ